MALVFCPKCGSTMSLRSGKFGRFYGCNNYPDCRSTRPFKASDAPKVVVAAAPVVKMPGSPEQETIWTALLNDSHHIAVKALAGTGKSFLCRQGMLRVPSHLRVAYFVFGKDAQTEFASSAPANCTVKTLNAAGLSICRKSYPKARTYADKVKDLIGEVWQPRTPQEIDSQRMLVNAVEKLVNLCQNYLLDGTDAANLMEVCTRHEVELDSDIAEVALKLLPTILTLSKERRQVLSFTDQMWLPVVLDLPCDKYDLIFIDEAQDLNALQHRLVVKMLAKGGRVVVVGDDNQAIYGFRGSDVDSIANLTKLLEEQTGTEVREYPLTVSRRCDKAIVAHAQQYVPEYRAMADKGEGEVISVTEQSALSMYKPGDMVICRVNAPLAHIAYGLLKQGTPAIIRGRDIGQGLMALINKLHAPSVNSLLVKLEEWKLKECAKVAGTRREDSIVQQINDKVDCIVALSEGCDSITDLLATIDKLFTNENPKGAVILSSIHKAKGLESPTVFWLYPTYTCKAEQDWQVVQERNAKYVAATRALHRLVLVQQGAKRAA